MQGVEILTTSQVATGWAFDWTAFWITFGMILGICTIVGIYYTLTDLCEWYIIPVLFIFGIVLGIPCGYGLGDECKVPINYETQYKVTISDEVTMTDFYEHYEVIDQDGKIFTVREKTNE